MDRGPWCATYSPGLPRVRQDGATNTQGLKSTWKRLAQIFDKHYKPWRMTNFANILRLGKVACSKIL